MSELLVDALISDMDGVLVDTGGVYTRHWTRWAEEQGIDADEVLTLHFGRPAAETIRVVAPGLDAVAEAQRYNDVLSGDTDASGIVALPGAAQLLAALPGDRWAVATSAPGVMARRWLRHAGLPVPRVLVSVDDVARGKPAPDPYLRAAELLGVEPGRCLVIEDAPAGIISARAAGTTVLALQTTHHGEDLAGAHHVTRDLGSVSVELEDGRLRVRWS